MKKKKKKKNETIPSNSQRANVDQVFDEGEFFDEVNINLIYRSWDVTIGRILGDMESIYVDGEDTITRGHLAARMDFTYSVMQRATDNYLNVAPQWEIFNKCNWNVIERGIRDFSIAKNMIFKVYTGVTEVLSLKDKNRELRHIYLNYNPIRNIQNIRVPRFFYKVVLSKDNSKGVVFVGRNFNNKMDQPLRDYCEDVSQHITWIKWADMKETGRVVACTVADFMRKNRHLAEEISRPNNINLLRD